MSEDKIKIVSSVGRRKTASARVSVSAGTGNIVINGKTLENYFAGLPRFHASVLAPLITLNCAKQYDMKVTVCGGGVMAQSEAIRHGLSRVLAGMDAGFKTALKKKGFLTRDSRAVERKKPGKAKARKSFQWTKR